MIRNMFGLSYEEVPALGDIRNAHAATLFVLWPGVERRSDWGRVLDALGQAVARGADIEWARGNTVLSAKAS